jgi:hypothetical protein
VIKTNPEERESLIQQMARHLEGLEVPHLHEILRDIVLALKSRDEGKKGARVESSGGASLYNCIPSSTTGPCHSVLLVYCFGWQNFKKRLQGISDHVAKNCPDTRQIIFVTDAWMPSVWEDFERLFMVMPANLTVLLYVRDHIVPLF